MNELSEILDEYGWFPGYLDDNRKQTVLFRWMQQATQKIERMEANLDELSHIVRDHIETAQKVIEQQRRSVEIADELHRRIQELQAQVDSAFMRITDAEFAARNAESFAQQIDNNLNMVNDKIEELR